MPDALAYNVVLVGPGWTKEFERKGAPTESWMCEWAARHNAKAVVRYYPKYGGWKILDVRKALYIQLGQAPRRRVWRGQHRIQRVYPSEESAVMVAMSLLGTQPSML